MNKNIEKLNNVVLARICVANFREEGEIYLDKVVGEAGESTSKVFWNIKILYNGRWTSRLKNCKKNMELMKKAAINYAQIY